MKIEIDLTEEAAACLWDDVTWSGRHPRTIGWICQSYMEGRAAIAIANTPALHRPAIIAQFRAAHHAPAPAPLLPAT